MSNESNEGFAEKLKAAVTEDLNNLSEILDAADIMQSKTLGCFSVLQGFVLVNGALTEEQAKTHVSIHLKQLELCISAGVDTLAEDLLVVANLICNPETASRESGLENMLNRIAILTNGIKHKSESQMALPGLLTARRDSISAGYKPKGFFREHDGEDRPETPPSPGSRVAVCS